MFGLAASVLIALLQLGVPAGVAAADGLSDTATTTYTVNPEAGRVDVTIDLSIHNSKPSVTTYEPCVKYVYSQYLGYYPTWSTCPRTTRYYVNESFVYLEKGAAAIKVTGNAGTPKITLYKKSDGFDYDEYRITFTAVYNGQTRNLHVTYQVPSGAPRSTNPTRIGIAYTSFCVIANGYDAGTTKVIIPTSYSLTVDPHHGTFTTSTAGGKVTYATASMPNPFDFWACFDGDNLAGYTSSKLSSPEGRSIDIQSWPEDAAWRTDVSDEIAQSLGALEKLIGMPLPGSGPIVVREVSEAELGAYAGTFDYTAGVARVSEDFTQVGVVPHELSHAWFNDSLYRARWLSEGSAGWAESTITHVACNDPGPYPGTGTANLGVWTFAGPRATTEELDAIDFEYAASCYVVSSVAGRMGEARMRDVLSALTHHEIAYRSGDLVVAGPAGAQDWRNWLDAVDELGLVPAGVEDLDYAQNLLLKFGVSPGPAVLLERSVARAKYHDLGGAIGSWVIPEAVLRPMGEWRFADATSAMDLETATFTTATSVHAVLPEVDAVAGPVEALVAKATTLEDLRAAADQATAQKAAADEVAAARTSFEGSRDALAQVGLIGTDLQPALDAAVAAVAAINTGTAHDQAALIERTLADAPNQGLVRLAVVVGRGGPDARRGPSPAASAAPESPCGWRHQCRPRPRFQSKSSEDAEPVIGTGGNRRRRRNPRGGRSPTPTFAGAADDPLD